MSEIILNGENWLGSQEGMVTKTATITAESGATVTENGRTIIKAGTLINDASIGYGFLLRDVDVTDGTRVGTLMIRGKFINSGLPSSLSTAQRDALAQQGLFDVEKSVLQLYVQPVSGTETLFGKQVSDLQTNIIVGGGAVNGTLNYIEGYTGFSSIPAEQNGNYLALKATAMAGATITAQVINGTHGAVTLDSDGMIVVRVANNNQSIRFIATYGDDTETVEYNFTNLVLVPQPLHLEVRAATNDDGALFGKYANDLQSGITVGTDEITGTLSYISDYSAAFSGSDASGNYLALKCTAIAGAAITVEVLGGYSGPVTLDNDGLVVDRIASTSQSIRVVASYNGTTETKTFALTGLVLTAAPAPTPSLTSIAANDVLSGFEFDTSLSINEVKAIIDQIPDATSGQGKTIVHMDSTSGELITINQDGLYVIQYFDGNGFSAIAFASEAVQEYGIETAGWQPALNNGVLELPNADTVESIDTASASVWNGILVGGVSGTSPSSGLTPFAVGDTLTPDANDKYHIAVDTTKTAEVESFLTGLTYEESGGMGSAAVMASDNDFPILMAIKVSDGGVDKYALTYSGGESPVIYATDDIEVQDFIAASAGWNSNISNGVLALDAPNAGQIFTIGTISNSSAWNGVFVGKLS